MHRITVILLVQQIIDTACLKCGSDWSVHIFEGNVFHSLSVEREKEFWNKVEWAKSCDGVVEFGFCTTAHPMPIGFVCCSYFLDMEAYDIFCLASWLPLYHLTSKWLQLPLISTPLLHGFICNTMWASLLSTPIDYAYCLKLDCVPNSNPLFPVPLLP